MPAPPPPVNIAIADAVVTRAAIAVAAVTEAVIADALAE